MASQCQSVCEKTGVRCGLPEGHYGNHQNGDRNSHRVGCGNTWSDSEAKKPAEAKKS